MRRFRGQRISEERDFCSNKPGLDHVPPSSRSFNITLGDIPKDELLATAAMLQDDTLYKLGLRKHTVKRPTGRRVVSCFPNMESSSGNAQETLPKIPSRLKPEGSSKNQRVMSLAPPRNPPNLFSKQVPQRVKTSKNKLKIDEHFQIESKKTHKSSDSLILEIIETYSELGIQRSGIESLDWFRNESPLPDLVDSFSTTNSSVETDSQFSFEFNDERNMERRSNRANSIKSRNSDKPLPPIPVKKLSQSKYRNYNSDQNSAHLAPSRTLDPLASRNSAPNHETKNEYIISRTGGDTFRLSPETEQVVQEEDDLEKFTRKCSTSSSRYSSSSGSISSIYSKDQLFKSSSKPQFSWTTPPSSPEMNFLSKNPYSPKSARRNLTPIMEKKGYEDNKTMLTVANL